MLATLSPARRRLALAVGALVMLATVVAGGVVIVRAVTDDVTPVAQDQPGPVLLVSGYGGSVASLEPLRAELESAGRDVVVVPATTGGTGDIEKQAKVLDRVATDALERYDAGSVDVVGYSAGGLVARSWVTDHGGGDVARRVLSIGSPQHGTSLAEIGLAFAGQCPEACRQMVPDSTFLRRLNADGETPEGPAFVSMWTTSDEVVVPPVSARLEGALNFTVQSVCAAVETPHSELPEDPVVLAALATTLGAGPPKPPDDVTCA